MEFGVLPPGLQQPRTAVEGQRKIDAFGLKLARHGKIMAW